MESYDIIIVGGGMVGCALACALAQQTSLSIAVLEVQPASQEWSETQYHHRVSAISLSSQRIFHTLQVWDALVKKRVSPFKQIQVWDARRAGEIQFESVDIAEPVLGYIIENNLIQSVLQEKIKHYPQVTFISPITLTAVSQTEKGTLLSTDEGRQWIAKLVIAADGAHSFVRKQVGIAIDKNDYEQDAIVATVETTLAHQQVARQVFLSTGPLAFLPLAQPHTCSIVWSLPKDKAQELKTLDMDTFKQALTQAFSSQLGDIVHVGQRFTFPLQKQQAKNYVKTGIALVGDAAHTMHPLAGQGVNMGLLDAASLADVIVDACHQHRNFASLSQLRRYERWRRADNLALLEGVDVIKALFANDKNSMKRLLSLGLNMANKLPWIKNALTRHAVGRRGDLPKLAR